MKTFIPWARGKTALRPVLYRLFPHSINHYVEVFGGSVALLFGRSPQKGVVEVYKDLNNDLVNLFLCVITAKNMTRILILKCMMSLLFISRFPYSLMKMET